MDGNVILYLDLFFKRRLFLFLNVLVHLDYAVLFNLNDLPRYIAHTHAHGRITWVSMEAIIK